MSLTEIHLFSSFHVGLNEEMIFMVFMMSFLAHIYKDPLNIIEYLRMFLLRVV